MKKIYMILAAIALLSMSLNAQVLETLPQGNYQLHKTELKGKSVHQNNQFSFNDVLRGIKGMSSILPESYFANSSSSKGQFRAPNRYTSPHFTLGPFEGDNFDDGIGFPNAYTNAQPIKVTTLLTRSEFEDYIGEEIIGFRFALMGDAPKTVKVKDFMAWLYNSDDGLQESYTWLLNDLEGNTEPDVSGSKAPVKANRETVTVASSDFSDASWWTIVSDNQGSTWSVTGGAGYYHYSQSYAANDWLVTSPIALEAGKTYTFKIDARAGISSYPEKLEVKMATANTANALSSGVSVIGETTLTNTSYTTLEGTVTPTSSGNFYFGIHAMSARDMYNLYVDNMIITTDDSGSGGNDDPTSGDYMDLAPGQWHEFYLDEPVEFEANANDSYLFMGYEYWQYPSSNTSQILTPVGVNSQSTSHNHMVYMTTGDANANANGDIVITVPSYYTMFYQIVVFDGETGNTLTTWDATMSTTTSGNYTYYPLPTGWSHSSGGQYMFQYTVTLDDDSEINLGYCSSTSQSSITIANSALQGKTNVGVYILAAALSDNQSIDINGDTRSMTSGSFAEFEWDNIFGVAETSWNSIDFSEVGDLAVQLILKSSTNPTIEITPATQTIDDTAAGSLTVTGTDIEGNISVSADNNTDWSLNSTSLPNNGGNVNVSYTGRALSASTTVTASATGATDATATVNYVADVYIVTDNGVQGNWNFTDGTHMTYNNGIYTATFTANADNTFILFARMLGNDVTWNTRYVFGPDSNGDWVLNGDSGSGTIDVNDDDPIKLSQAGTYTVTIDATDPNNVTFTITRVPDNQTATPVITTTDNGDSVTITATGDGTVTLTVGTQVAEGEGTVSITIPYGPEGSTTVTATATAQEDGKAESAPATAQVTIPGGGSDWLPMDGTYDNPNTLLSFTVDGEEIMLVDQFKVSTMYNTHPDGYTYTLREGEKTSTPVDIPVYKTSSTMQGLYTLSEIESDTDMHLKAQALNSAMSYEVDPDHNTLYHSLYRGALNADYPEITVQSRVSQLQKYEEMDENDNVHYFFKEMHTSGVTPMYDHVANEIVTPLDTNYVTGVYEDEISYVPVIWTFGLYSGREDGKNNSYGSDIKRETLGKVDVSIEGSHSGGNNAENTGNGWEGLYEYNGVTYCIYTPIITITGTTPETRTQNDGDVSEYEPYMFRAWCLYDGARKFANNAQGILIDDGERPAPFLLGEQTVTADVDHVTIGSAWQQGQGPLQWAFAVPENTQGGDIQFAVRFYYKKKVTEAGTAPEGDGAKVNRDGDAEYYIVENTGNGSEIGTFINEFLAGKTIVGQTYVNAQGMKSSKPFEGLNIVITRYSDGTTSTTKVIR